MTTRPFMMNIKPKPKEPIEKEVVHVEPSAYQPSKAEMEEDLRIDATPEELLDRMFRPMKVVPKKGARKRGKRK